MNRAIPVFVLSAWLVSCTTMQAVNYPPIDAVPVVRNGQLAQIIVKDGRVIEMTITRVSNEAISGVDETTGRSTTVKYSDITRLAVKRIDWKLSMIPIGVAAAVLLAAIQAVMLTH